MNRTPLSDFFLGFKVLSFYAAYILGIIFVAMGIFIPSLFWLFIGAGSIAAGRTIQYSLEDELRSMPEEDDYDDKDDPDFPYGAI